MSMFTLAISCLATSNFPWFVDLTFQVPRQYCSFEHHTLLLSPVTSTAGCCFCFGCIPSFFLELFLHWSPVAYWTPTDLESSFFSVLSFCLFELFTGFSRQYCWSGLPFPSQWTTFCQTSSPWSVCLGWPHRAWLSFIELDKAVVHVIRLASCLWLWFQSVCPLMPSLSAYHLTLFSLTLDVGYLFTAAPAKRSHCSWYWMWGSSSWSRHWPWAWGSSSQPLLRCGVSSTRPLLHHCVAATISVYLCILYFSIKIRAHMKINSKCYLNKKFDIINFKKNKTKQWQKVMLFLGAKVAQDPHPCL